MLWPQRHAIRVTVYTKQGCHLCDEAMRALQRLHGEFVLSIDEFDITGDPTVFHEYQHIIPVIDIEGGPRLLPRFDEEDLRSALRAVNLSDRSDRSD